jgi:hypothetical protein
LKVIIDLRDGVVESGEKLAIEGIGGVVHCLTRWGLEPSELGDQHQT